MCRKLIKAVAASLLLMAGIGAPAQTSGAPIEQAKTAIAHNQLDDAEHILWSAISSDPSNVAALKLLAQIRAKQQRFSEAEALWRRVLQLDPNASGVNNELAKALLAQNKDDEAIGVLKEAVAADSRNYPLRIQLSELYVKKKAFADALSTIDPIPDKALPVSAVAVKGAALVGSGKVAAAAGLIPRVAGSESASLELARVFVDANQPDLALETMARVSKVGKNSAKLYYLRGSAERQKGELASAKKSFELALTAQPNSAETLLALAEIAAAQKQTSESVKLLQRANKANPDSVPVLRNLVQQAMNAGLHGLVEQAALDLEKKSPELNDQFLAGAALLQEREYEIASRIFERYVASRTDDSKAFLALGLAYLNQQKYPDSQIALEHALTLDPNLIEAEYSLGVLFSKEGNNPDALVHFQRVLKAQPNHAKALLDSGSIYLQSGDLDKAKMALEASEKADAKDANLQYQLSLLYSRLGKTEEARKHMDAFRSLKPGKSNVAQSAN